MAMKIVWLALIPVCIVGCGEQTDTRSPADTSTPRASADSPYGEATSVADLEKSYEAAKVKFEADKHSAAAKAEFAKAASELAFAVMSADGVPREKYPKALKLAGEALAVEPKNDLAVTVKMQIEAVYESMGKTPPTGG